MHSSSDKHMKTKLGQVIPEELATALQKDERIAAMWNRLRPSCQRSYVNLYNGAKKPETKTRRVQRILKMTSDYYQRHLTRPGSVV